MIDSSRCGGAGLSRFLFIYRVRSADAEAFCTVLSYGRTQQDAERVAINRVHQQGLHIVRTDTATAAPWLDPARDADYLSELERYGSAFALHAA
jgi:hypothetical protein